MNEETYRKEPTYIMSKPPTKPFLYHHAIYSGLKLTAQSWGIRASVGKHTISLTTDPGRFLSPLPIIAAITIDGVVKMPFNEDLQRQAIPCLYVTHNVHMIDAALRRDYRMFTTEQIPPEYRYIMKFVTHKDMFIDENEYVVITDGLSLPTDSVIYIHPAKLKRFKAGLSKYSMADIRSLEELTKEI
jgi:hypothetical protein